MYISPIEIIYRNAQTQIEEDTLKTIHSYGINVDKEELIKALNYDRDQYNKGFNDALEEIKKRVNTSREIHHFGLGEPTITEVGIIAIDDLDGLKKN